jgi:hypothetical protein
MVGCERAFRTLGLDVRRTLIGMLTTGLLWSCSGKSTQHGDVTTGPVSESDFAPTVVDAICGNVGNCCAAAAIPYDRAGCEAFLLEELELEPPPNATWDSVAAGKCIDWFERIASSCYEVETAETPCTRIYRGTLPEGAACADSNECADIRGSEATCRYDDMTLLGTCALDVEPARGRAGDACASTCSDSGCGGFGAPVDGASTCYLEDGLVCSLSSFMCVPPPGVGEPCGDSWYCAAGAYCDSLVQICQATKSDGDACEFDEECTRGRCADLRCGPRSIASTEICSGS